MDISLDRSSRKPLYRQIYTQIRQRIRSGDLPAGTRLPPERRLAEMLGVNRTTVVNAYRELAAEGLVEARVGSGTVVCAPPALAEAPRPVRPFPWPEHFAPPSLWRYQPGLDQVMSLCARPDIISLAGGIPAPESYPVAEFREIIAAGLAEQGAALLQPTPTTGYYPLREWLAARLTQRGAQVHSANVLILSGSQQGLDLVARALLEPGDLVISEVPLYLGALQPFGAMGVRLRGVPVDEKGMRLDVLESLLRRQRPKLIYTLPTFQNPTGVTLSLERREQLLALAQRYEVPILEDDPYGELWYDEPPPPPIKALDRHGYVIYLSTFSKMLFPGLRIGWLAAPQPVVERLARVKQGADLHTNTLGQWAVAEFCRRGLLEPHLERIRPLYRQRREAMLRALEKHAPAGLRWNRPGGGFYLWCRLPEGVRARELLEAAGQEGVAFVSGDVFFPDERGQDHIRLNFSFPDDKAIAEGVRRLCTALKQLLERRQAEEEVRRAELAAGPIV